MNSTDSWASAAESTARAIAHTAAAIYMAGFALGLACHWLNDRLAAAWRQLLVPAPAAHVTAPEPPTDVIEAVAQLQAMTHRQLMAVTGCRRKLAKRDLILMAIA